MSGLKAETARLLDEVLARPDLFTVRRLRSDHGHEVRKVTGEYVGQISSSPEDYRGVRNARAAMWRAGLPRTVDRKAQRAQEKRQRRLVASEPMQRIHESLAEQQARERLALEHLNPHPPIRAAALPHGTGDQDVTAATIGDAQARAAATKRARSDDATRKAFRGAKWPMTAPELAGKAGIAVTTVKSALERFAEAGQLYQRPVVGRGGRGGAIIAYALDEAVANATRPDEPDFEGVQPRATAKPKAATAKAATAAPTAPPDFEGDAPMPRPAPGAVDLTKADYEAEAEAVAQPARLALVVEDRETGQRTELGLAEPPTQQSPATASAPAVPSRSSVPGTMYEATAYSFDGGQVLVDEAGRLFVARPLVEVR